MSTEQQHNSANTDDSEKPVSSTPAANPEQPFARLQLLLDGDNLLARLTPNSSDNPVSKFQIEESIKQQKFDAIPLDEAALKQVLAQASNRDATDIVIGTRHHAKAELVTSSDKMQCVLTITPARGGDPLTFEQLIDQLDAEGISADCRDMQAVRDAFEESLNADQVAPRTVASGTQAVHGEDSQFRLLLQLPEQQSASLEEDGTVNYFETRQYPTVLPGTELMRRSEPTLGQAGKDIFGKPIKARDGKALKFGKCQGAEISAADDNLLLATTKGHPVIGAKSVSVSDTLELKNVDLSSGNIHFDGSVTITGNVCSQMRVEASGDIVVRGSVENATLKAGNNILIGAGVISEQVASDLQEPPSFTSTLHAGGNIEALFFNQADVRAHGDISARHYAMNCQLQADHKIVLGDGGGKGVLLGGTACAGESVVVNTLGSSAYVKTHLNCASKKRLTQQLQLLTGKQQRREKEQQQLQLFIDKINTRGKPDNLGQVLLNKARKIEAALQRLSADLDTLGQQRQSLQRLLDKADSASITINQKLFPNCQISINDIAYISKDERNKTTLAVKGKRVTHE